jgi:hypothetical protein
MVRHEHASLMLRKQKIMPIQRSQRSAENGMNDRFPLNSFFDKHQIFESIYGLEDHL